MFKRLPQTLTREQGWQPLSGWVEKRPGVWEPDDYSPTPWEIQAPEVRDEHEAHQEFVRCAKSLPYFLLVHGWTVAVDDPEEETPQWRKFPAYPYLRRLFRDLQHPQNTLIEKSRQMTLSWALMGVFLWDISFNDNWPDLLISRREREVDDGGATATYNSLIGKVRHIWLALPPYLQQPLEFKEGLIRHAAANSFIMGETGTTKAGRGAAAKRALVDEAAFVEKSETVFKSVRQVAKTGTILNSTANGKGNAFYRIKASATTTFAKHRFHWTMHPVKSEGLYCTCGWESPNHDPAIDRARLFQDHTCSNLTKSEPHPPEPRSPWYDTECRDMTMQQVASELDISYEESARGRVYAFFDSGRSTFEQQDVVSSAGEVVGPQGVRERKEVYRERYLRSVLLLGKPCVIGWDFGVADPTSLLFGQVINEDEMRIRWLDEYQNTQQSWTHYRDFVNGLWVPLAKECSQLDLMHYGDPAGSARSADLTSWIGNLKTTPVPSQRIHIVTGPKNGTKLEWLDFIGNLMRQGIFEVSDRCTNMIDALQNYHYPADSQTGELIPGKQEPVHDEWSHAMDAMRYVYAFRWPARLRRVDNTFKPTRALTFGKGDRTVRKSF